MDTHIPWSDNDPETDKQIQLLVIEAPHTHTHTHAHRTQADTMVTEVTSIGDWQKRASVIGPGYY